MRNQRLCFSPSRNSQNGTPNPSLEGFAVNRCEGTEMTKKLLREIITRISDVNKVLNDLDPLLEIWTRIQNVPFGFAPRPF